MGPTLVEQLVAKARSAPQRIALPEADDGRILLAAREVADRGIGQPILVGNPQVIAETATEHSVDLAGIEIADPGNPQTRDRVVADYLLRYDRLSEKSLRRKLARPLDFACGLVMAGRADCVAAGAACPTSDVILAAQTIIGPQEGIETISSMGFLDVPRYQGPSGELVAVADCAVCVNPDPRELADIAAATAQTVQDLLGWQPRVAMLSFSTKGSGDHPMVSKVAAAVEIARERYPGLLVDGEFQLDAAIDPGVAARKVPGGSDVAGRANVLVFPDLNAGNIAVKLVQQFAGGSAHGPLLQGFARPVTDFSRGAPVHELVGAITMVAVQAQGAGARQARARLAEAGAPELEVPR